MIFIPRDTVTEITPFLQVNNVSFLRHSRVCDTHFRFILSERWNGLSRATNVK